VPTLAQACKNTFTGLFFDVIVCQLMPKSLSFRRILGFVILLAALTTSAVIINYFVNTAKQETKNLSKSISTDITMKTIHLTENQQNIKKWELFAQSGIHDKNKQKTNLEEVRFIVERRNSSPVTVTARHGQYEHQPR
jgi:LPS export ABC transporter protein LptC